MGAMGRSKCIIDITIAKFGKSSYKKRILFQGFLRRDESGDFLKGELVRLNAPAIFSTSGPTQSGSHFDRFFQKFG